MLNEQDWIADAVEVLAGSAIAPALEKANCEARYQNLPQANRDVPERAKSMLPAANPIRNAINKSPAKAVLVAHSEPPSAPAEPDGQICIDNRDVAAIGHIVELHRRRWDMIRARQRLDLQAQSALRRMLDGDKAAAAKAWAKVKAAPDTADPWLAGYVAACQPLLAVQADTERRLAKAVKALPIHSWAKQVAGLGDVSLSAIIGECAHPVGSYRSPAAVWKRMGLAVIEGERQRRVTGDAALLHGYNAERRAIMWNIGACLIKAQVRAVKGDDGSREGSVAIGAYGQLYLDRKAIEVARTETAAHAHNRAQRYIEKRLLKDLWRAWRAGSAPEAAAERIAA